MVANRLNEDGDVDAVRTEPAQRQKCCNSYWAYKILSIIYSIVFFFIGGILLALGIWILFIKQEFDSVHDVLTSPAILAIVVGAIMVSTAIVGLIAAIASRLWPLRVFLGIVIVVLIIQVVIGTIAFVHREQTIENIDEYVESAIEQYYDNKHVKYAVDKVQLKFKCCGLNNLSDWTSNRVYACDSKLTEKKYSCHVPDSCCKNSTLDCGIQIKSNAEMAELENKNVYTSGCRWQFLSWLENNLDVIGATALGFAILNILGIFVVYMFITKVEDYHRLFKYRKRFFK